MAQEDNIHFKPEVDRWVAKQLLDDFTLQGGGLLPPESER